MRHFALKKSQAKRLKNIKNKDNERITMTKRDEAN